MQIHDYMYVEDVVEFNLLAMHQGFPGVSIFNGEIGKSTAINQVFQHVEKIFGAGSSKSRQPVRDGAIYTSLADVEPARYEIGWHAAWELERGLRVLIDSQPRNRD